MRAHSSSVLSRRLYFLQPVQCAHGPRLAAQLLPPDPHQTPHSGGLSAARRAFWRRSAGLCTHTGDHADLLAHLKHAVRADVGVRHAQALDRRDEPVSARAGQRAARRALSAGAGIQGSVDAVLREAGLDPKQMTTIDNSCPADGTSTAGVSKEDASKDKLEWKDVFELTEWFRPGTLKKNADFDPNAM